MKKHQVHDGHFQLLSCHHRHYYYYYYYDDDDDDDDEKEKVLNEYKYDFYLM